MYRIIFRLFLLLLIPFGSRGQFPLLDIAKKKVPTSRTKPERLNALLALSDFKNSMSGDTISYYARMAWQLALELGDEKALARSAYQLISGDLASGKTDSIIPKIESNPLFLSVKQTDPFLYYKLQLLKANVLNRTNRLPEALALQLKLLNEAEKENNTLASLFLMNYIGATYLNAVDSREEARKTWTQALDIIRKANNPQYREIESYILSNMALYYIGNYYANPAPALSDTCFDFINRTVSLSREIESMGVLASVLSYRGALYGYQKKEIEAERDFKELMTIRNKIGDPLYITDDLKNLAFFYIQHNEPDKAIAAATEGLMISEKFHIRETAMELLNMKASAYKQKGDHEHHAETLEKILLLNDSINRANSADKIEAIRTQYEVQKKETLIARQKLDLFKRKIYLYAGAVLFILIAVFTVYRFKKYQRGHRQLLEEKRLQNEIEIKEAADKERNRIAAELHDNLGVQANAILHNSNRLVAETSKQAPVVSRLQETAKEMLLNLRETLWALKNADVPAVEMWLRVIGFMQQMGRHYTGIRFIVQGKAPQNLVLSASKALHLVLVIQETVNNSVRHSGAYSISVHSILENDEWKIMVKDNGKGFDTVSAFQKKDSYGLQHMQERAETGDFVYEIKSVIDEGTQTTIHLKI